MQNNSNTLKTLIEMASRNGTLAFFVGAGISRGFPTSMPTVPDIVTAIEDNILSVDAEIGEAIMKLDPYLKQMPFETLLSTIHQGIDDKTIKFLECLRTGTPNATHHFLGHLLIQNKIKTVITPNFDNMIELALGDYVQHIKVRQGFGTLSRTRNPEHIVKLHGSFYDCKGIDISETINTTIETIANGCRIDSLDWLRHVFDSHLTIFLGYSGSDRLDITPALQNAGHSSLIWVHHDPSTKDICIGSDYSRYPEILQRIFADPNHYVVRCNTHAFLEYISVILHTIYNGKLQGSHIQKISLDDSFKWHREFALLTAGFIALSMGFGEQELALKSLSRFIDKRNTTDIYHAKALVGIGQVLELLGQHSKAAANYMEALSYYRQTGNKRGIAITLNDLGICRAISNSREVCIDYYTEALGIAKEIKDNDVIGMTYHNTASLNANTDFDKSRDYYLKAAKHFQQSGNILREILVIHRYLYMLLKNHPKELITDKMLSLTLYLLKLCWASGVNEPLKLAEIKSICAIIFDRLYGSNAVNFATSNETLVTIGMASDIAHIIPSVRL